MTPGPAGAVVVGDQVGGAVTVGGVEVRELRTRVEIQSSRPGGGRAGSMRSAYWLGMADMTESGKTWLCLDKSRP